MTRAPRHSRIVAVLGPTNTGKTHLAIDRMLGHASGMIGFPLRLLARENYDRIVRLKGRNRVALVTGEEKIVPRHAVYFVCTVESMPLDRPVAFLAVDEIQLCADPERGHVFTDRLLRARGDDETMFLGAETIRPLIRRLVPDAEFDTRPRFSSLTHTGETKLARLKRRSAVVAFSAADVYHIAEHLRRQRGGTAVVLGALSPRTRNAQVELYQAGEVDYLVATDAIGMGLNMDIDHVAFARLGKFDGFGPRRLRPAEIAQIAGRAGRHMADGTFGTTDRAGPLEPETVAAVEGHQFEPLRVLQWRNTDLDMRSPAQLLRSLERRPPVAELRRAPDADDHLTLAALARDPDIARRAQGRALTALLWEVCQIPDFRKVLSDNHTRMVHRIFDQLSARGRLDTDWAARLVARLDRTEGDIDTLMARIAHVRTWTYIAHRPDWLADPGHWQDRTRAVEDRLSDALHDRLTQRFIDRRSALLVKSMAAGTNLTGAVGQDGSVTVEGAFVGQLQGFRFIPDRSTHDQDAKALLSAARRALRTEIADRVRRLAGDADDAFDWSEDGEVHWRGAVVGRAVAGADPMTPAVRPVASDLLEPSALAQVRARLDSWLTARVAEALRPVLAVRDAPLTGTARGIAYQLVERLGAERRQVLAPLIDGLTAADRAALAAAGIRLGASHVYIARAVKPRVVAMRARLWWIAASREGAPPVPAGGCPSVVRDKTVPDAFYEAIGYVPAGDRAVRVDRLEALAAAAAKRHRKGPFAATGDLARLIGSPVTALPEILAAIGYVPEKGGDGGVAFRRRSRRRKPARRPARISPDSPFAKLRAPMPNGL
ncbi:MAG: helicase-related protein [Inquilinaceae bacterium]